MARAVSKSFALFDEPENDSFLAAARDIPSVMPKADCSAVILASLSANLLALALPLMTMQVYDRIVVSGGQATMGVLAAGVVGAVVAEWMLRVARSYVMGAAGAKFEIDASELALQKISDADLRDSERHEAGEYLEGLSAIGRMRDFYAGHLMSSIVDIPFIGIYLGLIAYLAGSMALVPLVLLGIFGVIVWMVGRHMRRLVQMREEGDSVRYSRVIEMLSGLHSVKALGLEAKMQRIYEGLLIESGPRDYALSLTNGLAMVLGNVFSQIMMVAVVVAGAPMVIEHKLSMGSLIACLLLAGRLTQPLMRALSLWAHFQEVRLARKQVLSLYALPWQARNPSSSPATANWQSYDYAHAEVAGEVRLQGAAFRYHEQGNFVLHDASLTIHQGEVIALMGDDAVGKTALMELIAGLYAPEVGSATVDGLPIASVSDAVRSRHVAYVPADAVIFRGTIMENMCQFNAKYESSARELAEWMGVAADVAKLPMGYETPLSPMGMADEISPGLRQRIAIVRSLVPHPRLLLFDNADHALDRNGYNCLFSLLGQLKGSASMVLATEDQNLQCLADRRLIVNRGVLIGSVPSAGRGKE